MAGESPVDIYKRMNGQGGGASMQQGQPAQGGQWGQQPPAQGGGWPQQQPQQLPAQQQQPVIGNSFAFWGCRLTESMR